MHKISTVCISCLLYLLASVWWWLCYDAINFCNIYYSYGLRIDAWWVSRVSLSLCYILICVFMKVSSDRDTTWFTLWWCYSVISSQKAFFLVWALSRYLVNGSLGKQVCLAYSPLRIPELDIWSVWLTNKKVYSSCEHNWLIIVPKIPLSIGALKCLSACLVSCLLIVSLQKPREYGATRMNNAVAAYSAQHITNIDSMHPSYTYYPIVPPMDAFAILDLVGILYSLVSLGSVSVPPDSWLYGVVISMLGFCSLF